MRSLRSPDKASFSPFTLLVSSVRGQAGVRIALSVRADRALLD